MVDWSYVWTVGTIIGAGLGGGCITTWWTKRHERADKLLEHRQRRDEASRVELRQAYARFVDSYSRLLSVGVQMADKRKALYAQREAAIEEALRAGATGDDDLPDGGDPAFIAASERLGNEFDVANVNARVHLAEVLLIENHPRRQASLLSIFDGWPQDAKRPDRYEEFEIQLGGKSKQLIGLLLELKGVFSPATWDAASAPSSTSASPESSLASERATSESVS